MGLIDRETAAKELQIIANKFWALGKRKVAEDYNFVLTCLDELAEAYPIDPVHYAGGCYCRECKFWAHDIEITARVAKALGERRACPVVDSVTSPGDFCSWGVKRSGLKT